MIGRMGVLYGYYAAADDQDARRAMVRDDGEPIGSGFDEIVVKGIDPAVDLLTAEVLITGRSADAVKADPRRSQLVGMVAGGVVTSVSLTDLFRDSLAGFDRELLEDVAKGWATSGGFYKPPGTDELTDFLRRLADLAQRAVARGHRLYCWICP